MKRATILALVMGYMVQHIYAQGNFGFDVMLEPIEIAGLPGMQSYTAAQHDGLWLIIGGRRDGLHARQPFNAFPESQNNTDIFVIDPEGLQFWSASVDILPAGLAEQLQSTNMCFNQREDTLYIVGGYGYSATAGDHITYDKLTTVDVPGLMNAVINGADIHSFFKQISDPMFAVTGGHLVWMNNAFYLVGGHRFDGNYNPMGNPTYTQTYTNAIRTFTVANDGDQLSFTEAETFIDEVHLHRRDYNLIPQVFPDGEEGFTISSGVFQTNVDLPYLYPIDIRPDGYTAVTDFNQYLCHYHTANAGMYDGTTNSMHTIFFGGMSQYYYNGNELIQDDLVPFVKTISRLTRNSDGSLSEYQMNSEMPAFQGSSAEFFYADNLPQYDHQVIKLHEIAADSILIGYVFGGIFSSTKNPFSVNQTNTTSADSQIYEVWLIRNTTNDIDDLIPGENPYSFTAWNDQTNQRLDVKFTLPIPTDISYFLTNQAGQIVAESNGLQYAVGDGNIMISTATLATQSYTVTLVFDQKFYVSKKVMVFGK